MVVLAPDLRLIYVYVDDLLRFELLPETGLGSHIQDDVTLFQPSSERWVAEFCQAQAESVPVGYGAFPIPGGHHRCLEAPR